MSIIDQSAREHVLLASLFDVKRYIAKDVAACYTQRWQIETSCRELKQTMMGMALTLRSRTVEDVYQKIGEHWAAVSRAYGKLPTLMQRLRQRLVMLLNEERPGRKIDRAVKALPQRYTVRVLKRDLN